MKTDAVSQEDTLAISGNLRFMCLSDLLQWISLGKKTGKLLVERDSLTKFILIKEGRIISSWSNNPREYFGHFLVSQRQITEEQLFRALVKQHKRKTLLGEILIRDGLLSEDAVRQVLETKTRETVFEVCSWSEGRFYFYEEECPESLKIALSLDISTLIFEGIKRIDDWTRIREQIPCSATTFKPIGNGKDLGELYRAILKLVEAGKTVEQIAVEMNLSDFQVSQNLCRLIQDNIIAVASTGEERKPAETVRAIRALIKRGDEEFKSGQLDESSRTFREVLALDSLNQYAKIYLLKIRIHAAKTKTDDTIPLNKVPVLCKHVEAEDVLFTPQETLVMERITGEADVGALVAATPLPEDETLTILRRLVRFSFVAWR